MQETALRELYNVIDWIVVEFFKISPCILIGNLFREK